MTGMPSDLHATLAGVVDDLRRVFGSRLVSVVAYGRTEASAVRRPSLALVSSLTPDDLEQCAACVRGWHTAGAATPLLLPRDEFEQSLDSFPVEFGEIIAEHVPVYGDDPFAGVSVSAADLRRAAEVHARSLLLHLRENYLETGGQAVAVADLVTSAAPGFATLLRLLARLEAQPVTSVADLDRFAASRIELDPRSVGDLLHLAEGSGNGIDAGRLFPDLLAALDALARHVDRWRAT